MMLPDKILSPCNHVDVTVVAKAQSSHCSSSVTYAGGFDRLVLFSVWSAKGGSGDAGSCIDYDEMFVVSEPKSVHVWHGLSGQLDGARSTMLVIMRKSIRCKRADASGK